MSEVTVKKVKSKSAKLLDLAHQYADAAEARRVAQEDLEDAKTRILKQLKVEKLSNLSEDEADDIERLKVEVERKGERAVISYFVSKRVDADWEYLEGKLSIRELKRAMKINRYTELRVRGD